MDQNTSKDKTPQSDEWLKTITDQPIPVKGKQVSAIIVSPYAMPEMPEANIGEMLGSGTILDVLGEGGFARVYKIHDQKLDLDRAVKVLLPTGKKEVMDRFLTEARITARLDNPYIVKVFRVDEWNGCPFIEMEFIDGKSLETILEERGVLPVYAVCAIGIFIAHALSYAHTLDFTLSDKHYKGVIHRDLKPANIMIHADGRLKLMDFGIARPIATGLHTMGENIVGTWQYLSPEQLNHKDIDQRTDIYAFGAILYELLCGAKTFPDDSVTELVNKKARGVYKPINDFPVNVPKKLCEVVDTCLRVEKEDRYQDAQSVIDALGNLFIQYCSDQPDVALKKFMEDPGYTPITSKLPKKKNNTTGLGSTKVHLPESKKKKEPLLKKIHIPKLPKLPKLQLPKIPKLPKPQLPKEQYLQMWKLVVNIVKNVFLIIARLLNQFWTFLRGVINSVPSIIKRVPKQVFTISAAVLGGVVLTTCLTYFGYKYINNIGPMFTKKAIAVDTVPIVKLPVLSTPVDTIKTENTPQLVSPTKDEIWTSETLNVVWNGIQATDTYSMHIATTQEFSDTIYFQTIVSDTFFSITEIEPGNYYCRTGISRTDGTIAWGIAHSFTFSPVYHTPHLLSPLQSDTCLDREVTFQWRNVPKIKGYYLNVAIDSNFTQLVFNDTNICRDTFTNVIFYDTSLVTYYWHVRTDDSSNWSSSHTFIIKDKKNYHVEAAKALRKGKLSSAEKALRKIAPADQFKDTLTIRLAEEYLKNTNFEKVKNLITTVMIKDMVSEYLRGQILTNEGNYNDAFTVFDAAIGLKTPYATRSDSANVFFARAAVAQKIYENIKNKKNGEKAYYAWDSVYKMYSVDQTNVRYKEAVEKMNLLYHTDKIFELKIEPSNKEPVVRDTLKKPPKNKPWTIKRL